MFHGLTRLILMVINFATLIAAAWAFIDCARRRPDAFPAIDRHSKGLWLVLTGASALVALIGFGPMSLLGIAAIVAPAVYLLDVRPRINEILRGRW